MNNKLIFLIVTLCILTTSAKAYDDATCKENLEALKGRMGHPGSMGNMKYKRVVRTCKFIFDGTKEGQDKFKGFVAEVFTKGAKDCEETVTNNVEGDMNTINSLTNQ